MPDIAGKLAEATQAMADALHNINAQFDGLHAKIDRIVAAVESSDGHGRCGPAREAGDHGEGESGPESAGRAIAAKDVIAAGDAAHRHQAWREMR